MKKIGKTEVLKALKNAVKRRGADYRDESRAGLYFHDNGKPACIVGDMLYHEWGVRKSQLNDENGSGVYEAIPELEMHGLAFSPLALNVLAEAQNTQDNGLPWGKALENAQQVKR